MALLRDWCNSGVEEVAGVRGFLPSGARPGRRGRLPPGVFARTLACGARLCGGARWFQLNFEALCSLVGRALLHSGEHRLSQRPMLGQEAQDLQGADDRFHFR